MSKAIGVREWVIAEGYIPPESHGPEPQMLSHETVCLLNAPVRTRTWRSRFTILTASQSAHKNYGACAPNPACALQRPKGARADSERQGFFQRHSL